MRVLAAAAAFFALSAHSPYGQWSAFRKSRLIVFAAADDEPAQRLARRVAELLAGELPGSRATWARAANALELVKLLGSHQADVALLTPRDAREAIAGRGVYRDEGAIPLRLIAAAGGYLLVALDELPAAHAYQLARALAGFEPRSGRPVGADAADEKIPLHPGTKDFAEGRPMPAAPAGRDAHRH